MKIVQINSVANTGSTGRIAEGIGKLIIQEGFSSFLVYGRRANRSKSKLIKIGNRFGQMIHLILTRMFDLHGYGSYFATYLLTRKLKGIKPDIIHLHNIHGYYINFPVLFKFLRKESIKVVWTFHDCWPFTGHCSHFVTANCEKWINGCSNCPLKKEYPQAFFDNSKSNWNAKNRIFNEIPNLTIVTPSYWLKKQVEKSFLGKRESIVINNGIDLGKFRPSPQELGKDPNSFLILGVSNVWTEKKGLKDFFKLRELLDASYEIVLIGLSKDQLKDLPKNIRGMERTESVEELASYYSRADLFFNPTYEDTFPTTNIEALACGTQVLTYATGGSPEIIDAETGYIIAQGNLEKTVTLIKEIRTLGGKKAAACRARAERYFNENNCFMSYIELYKKIGEL